MSSLCSEGLFLQGDTFEQLPPLFRRSFGFLQDLTGITDDRQGVVVFVGNAGTNGFVVIFQG